MTSIKDINNEINRDVNALNFVDLHKLRNRVLFASSQQTPEGIKAIICEELKVDPVIYDYLTTEVSVFTKEPNTDFTDNDFRIAAKYFSGTAFGSKFDEVYAKLKSEWDTSEVIHPLVVLFSLYRITNAYQLPDTHIALPIDPPEVMWDGIPRLIIDCIKNARDVTPKVLEAWIAVQDTVPDWLTEMLKPEPRDGTLTKGTLAVIVYKAMIENVRTDKAFAIQTKGDKVKLLCDRLLPILTSKARDHGWSISVHGSQRRDLDIVAVPWVDTAADESVLVEALRLAVAIELGGEAYVSSEAMTGIRQPFLKPLGRRAYVITSGSEQLIVDETGAHPYIDVSIVDQRIPIPTNKDLL